jgi:hypothetical protein
MRSGERRWRTLLTKDQRPSGLHDAPDYRPKAERQDQNQDHRLSFAQPRGRDPPLEADNISHFCLLPERGSPFAAPRIFPLRNLTTPSSPSAWNCRWGVLQSRPYA